MAQKSPFEDGKDLVKTAERAAMKMRSSLDEAVEIIKAHFEAGEKFTTDQLDVFTDAIVAAGLPPDEVPLFNEVAEQNRVPKWQALLAHWRRSTEQGSMFELFLDPGWEDYPGVIR